MATKVATSQITIIDWNDVTISATPPSPPVLNQLWFDQSITPPALKQWNGSVWVSANISPEEYAKLIGVEDNATNGATWGNNLNNIPIRFQEAPSGNGLYATSTAFGFYKSSVWKTYMANNGDFYLSGQNGNNSLSWVSATGTLQIAGNITAYQGYIGNGSSGWTIGNTAIYNGRSALTSGSGVYIGTDGIALGSTANNPEFKVTSSGLLSCRGATISGTLYVEDIVKRGNPDNLVSTPVITSATDKGKWSNAYGIGNSGSTTSPNAPPRPYWLLTSQRDTVADDQFQVTPGDVLTCSAWIETSSTSYTCRFGAVVYNASGAVIAWLSNASLASGRNWTLVSGCITMPAGAAYAFPWIQIDGFSTFGYCRISDMSITRSGSIAPGGIITASNIILGDGSHNGSLKTYGYTDDPNDDTPGIMLQDDPAEPSIKMKNGLIKGAKIDSPLFVGDAPTINGKEVATISYVDNETAAMETILKRYQTTAITTLSKQYTAVQTTPTIAAGDKFSSFIVKVPADTKLTLSGSINASPPSIGPAYVTFVFAFQDSTCIGVANSCGSTSPIVFEFDCIASGASQTYTIVTASNQTSYYINRQDLSCGGYQTSWTQLSIKPYESSLNSITYLDDGTFTVPSGVTSVSVTMTGGGGGGGGTKGWKLGGWWWGGQGGGGGSTALGTLIAVAGGSGGVGGAQNNGSDFIYLVGGAAAGCYRQTVAVTPGATYNVKIGKGGHGAVNITGGVGGTGYAAGMTGDSGMGDGTTYNTGAGIGGSNLPLGGVTTGCTTRITTPITSDNYQGHGQPGAFQTDGRDGYCIIEW